MKPAAWQARTVICWHIVPGVAVIHGRPASGRSAGARPARHARRRPVRRGPAGAGEARYMASVHRASVARPGSGPAAAKSYSWISATSRSPARSASATSAGSISEIIGSRPGCCRASAISAAGIIVRPALANVPMRSGPARPWRAPASSAAARSSCSSTVSACRTRFRPAGVSTTRRPLRSSSGRPGLPLQRAELLRDRRRGEGQRLRHGGDRAPVGQFAQQPQAANIKH